MWAIRVLPGRDIPETIWLLCQVEMFQKIWLLCLPGEMSQTTWLLCLPGEMSQTIWRLCLPDRDVPGSIWHGIALQNGLMFYPGAVGEPQPGIREPVWPIFAFRWGPLGSDGKSLPLDQPRTSSSPGPLENCRATAIPPYTEYAKASIWRAAKSPGEIVMSSVPGKDETMLH